MEEKSKFPLYKQIVPKFKPVYSNKPIPEGWVKELWEGVKALHEKYGNAIVTDKMRNNDK